MIDVSLILKQVACITDSIPYSRKYQRELNLVVGPQIANAKILADLYLAVW